MNIPICNGKISGYLHLYKHHLTLSLHLYDCKRTFVQA